MTERVDNAVENGRIDQTEADEKLAEAEAKITDMVNNGRPERGHGLTDQRTALRQGSDPRRNAVASGP